MVILDATLLGKRGLDGVSRGVVVDVLQGNGPVHDGADALANTPCGLRLGGPDGGEHVYHLPAGDLVHLQGSKNRKGVGLKSREPLRPDAWCSSRSDGSRQCAAGPEPRRWAFPQATPLPASPPEGCRRTSPGSDSPEPSVGPKPATPQDRGPVPDRCAFLR